MTPQNLLVNYTSTLLAEGIGAPWIAGLGESLKLNFNPTKRNSLRRQRKEYQRTNFASCWYVDSYESVAMWQLYSRPDSVAISIPYRALIDELQNARYSLTSYGHETISFGSVEYARFESEDDVVKVQQLASPGFLKDRSFEHEREFRMMLSITPRTTKPTVPKQFVLDEQVDELNRKIDTRIIQMKLHNYGQLPFEIIFHPSSKEWHVKNVKKLMSQLKLGFLAKESLLKKMFSD